MTSGTSSVLSVFLLGLLLSGPALAQSSPWKPGIITDYETQTPGLGFGRRYTSDYGWADVFSYSLNRVWPDTLVPIEYREPFDNALVDVRKAEDQGTYQHVKITIEPVTTIRGLRFHHATLRYNYQNRPMESHLLLTVHQGRLLKFRIWFETPVPKAAMDSIPLLISQHLALIDQP